MIEDYNLVGNTTSVLIERLFWLLLGIFLCSAIASNFIKSKEFSRKNIKGMEKRLKNLAEIASKKND